MRTPRPTGLRTGFGCHPMVRKLIDWAVHNPLIVALLAAAGGYAFANVNVEWNSCVRKSTLAGSRRHPSRTPSPVENAAGRGAAKSAARQTRRSSPSNS